MEWLHHLLSHVCGQGRCFLVDGVALPVCQRCTGLYVGAAVTVLGLLLTRLRRAELPSRGLVALHAGLLVVALLGGSHVLDFGPRWRLLCGLWTGHVAALWLITAGNQFRRLGSVTPWPRWASLAGWLSPALLASLAAAFPLLLRLGWGTWATAIVAGVMASAVAVAWALYAAVARMARGTRG